MRATPPTVRLTTPLAALLFMLTCAAGAAAQPFVTPGAATVSAGAAISVTVSNGPGNRADFVLMVPAGSAPMHWSGMYRYLSGSTTRPAAGMTAATISFTAPATLGDYEFRFFENDTWTLLAASSIVTVTAAAPAPAPQLTINGGTAPVTVAVGSMLTVGVVNGPGFRADFVMLVPAGSGAMHWSGIYQYLNGSTTRPASGIANATLTFAAPSSSGTYVLRLFENDTWTLQTTSAVVTVTAATPALTVNGGAGPVTVVGGSQLTVQVTNGPGFRADFVLLVPAGSAPTHWSGTYQYLSGTTTRPASGMTNATLTFTAPTSGGTYELRLFENDTWTLRANSSVVTVTPMGTLTTAVHATGLSTSIALVQDPADPDVQYVALHGGRIRVIESGVLQATDFLDLSPQIANIGEAGLLGLAFPPDYGTSRRFYVKFSNLAGDMVVARFQRSLTNPLAADPSTQLNLRWGGPGGLRSIPPPSASQSHKGGNIHFGSDGYLYISLGDGAAYTSAQNPGSLWGKMLRIDVGVPDSNADGYVVPADNPFVSAPPTLPEIWSFGFRNPWQFSFDDGPGGTGALIIADVGEISWEEINVEPSGHGGRNYGWVHREGLHPTPGVSVPPTPGAPTTFTDPAYEYDHSIGHSVTGGYLYRGTALGAAFNGRYFFADFQDRRLWSAAVSVGPGGEFIVSSVIEHTAQLGGPAGVGFVAAFGRDADGELYLVDYINGTIRRLVLAP
jgi:glucose/arabinose dehydrogenase